jgi:2-polyprenyl-3-methyl-5-hydroxy-6-metoxy-1,4-benzoquinol methylase
MNNLSELYSKQYVNNIVSKEWRYQDSDKKIQLLYNHFKPTSVMDIGAANGVHTNSWRKLGCTTYGVEGTVHFEQYLKTNVDEYIIQDIRQPFYVGKKFDLVISVEVLEHIEKEYIDITINNICAHGDVLFITANPSEGGHSHVNPQPKEYWIDLFTSRGYTYEEEETKIFSDIYRKEIGTGWYSEYSMIFRNK